MSAKDVTDSPKAMPALGAVSLLACPFCASQKIEARSVQKDGTDGYVWCDECEAVIFADTKAEAIARWNRRQANGGDERLPANNPKL